MSGWFKKFWNGVWGSARSDEKEGAPEPRLGELSEGLSRRKTPRQKTAQTGVVWVSLFDQTRVNVADLSYGGISLVCTAGRLKDFLRHDNVLECTLHIYHLAMPCELVVIHERDNHTGCAFIHSKAETLLFLRQVLEYIRMGSSVAALPKQIVRQHFQDAHSHMFQGDRGTEIRVRTGDKGVDYLEMQFTDGMSENRVVFENGTINATRFRRDVQEDAFPALEQAFFALLGFTEKFSHTGLESVAQAFRKEIDKRLESHDHRKVQLTA